MIRRWEVEVWAQRVLGGGEFKTEGRVVGGVAAGDCACGAGLVGAF